MYVCIVAVIDTQGAYISFKGFLILLYCKFHTILSSMKGHQMSADIVLPVHIGKFIQLTL